MLVYHSATGSCPVLINPLNGEVLVTGQTLGSSAVYTCESGFSLVGDTIRTCDGGTCAAPMVDGDEGGRMKDEG